MCTGWRGRLRRLVTGHGDLMILQLHADFISRHPPPTHSQSLSLHDALPILQIAQNYLGAAVNPTDARKSATPESADWLPNQTLLNEYSSAWRISSMDSRKTCS